MKKIFFLILLIVTEAAGQQYKLKLINDTRIEFGRGNGWYIGLLRDSIDDSFIVWGADGNANATFLEAAVAKFTNNKREWVVVDSGLNGLSTSYIGRDNCVLLSDGSLVAAINDPGSYYENVLVLLDSEGVKMKKEYPREKTVLFITKWRNNYIVGVEASVYRNGYIAVIDNKFNIEKVIDNDRKAMRFVTVRTLGDTLYLAASYGNLGTYVAKFSLLTGERYWIYETPSDSTFLIRMDINSEGYVFCAGVRFETLQQNFHQKFFLYKLAPDGSMLWYKEWYPEGDWRMNLGNWINAIKVYGDVVVIVGQVEKKMIPISDPNLGSAYLAVFQDDSIIAEEVWDYEKEGSPTNITSTNEDVVVFTTSKDTMIAILGRAFPHPYVTWTHGYIRTIKLTAEGDTTSPSDTTGTGTQPPDTTKPSSPPPLPTSYALYIYPNPFNGVATIRYEVPVEGEVVIMITDVLGRKIKEIKEIKTPNVYEMKFDASNLPSGVYVCRMMAGSFIQTRKMVLVK